MQFGKMFKYFGVVHNLIGYIIVVVQVMMSVDIVFLRRADLDFHEILDLQHL